MFDLQLSPGHRAYIDENFVPYVAPIKVADATQEICAFIDQYVPAEFHDHPYVQAAACMRLCHLLNIAAGWSDSRTDDSFVDMLAPFWRGA